MASEHVKKYLNRIESQHQSKPRYMAHVETLLDMLDGAYEVIRKGQENFNLDTAVGKQLDVIGSRVGVSRTVRFKNSANYGKVLDDESYRAYIRARIFANHWSGTLEDFYHIWAETMGDYLDVGSIEEGEMSATIAINGDTPISITEMILEGGIIPKPGGVKYDIVFDSSANILVSGDTDTFEQPAVYVSDDTYSGDVNTWLPLWAYLLTHSMSPAEMRDNSAVQAILQNFLALYNL